MSRVYCHCQGQVIERHRCDGCGPDDDWLYDEIEDDPPLYPAGKLAAMTLAELEREHAQQCDRQGRLGDAEHIDDRAVEETEARCRMVQAEIERRKAAPA